MGNWLFKQVMRVQIFFYRRSGGKFMGSMRGMPILILTTVGRKSGQLRETPVMYLQDGANYVVMASNAGRAGNPAWYGNLRANPEVTIDVGGDTRSAIARDASADERKRLWPLLLEKAPFFDDYQKNTSRVIPMVILSPRDNRQRSQS